MCGYCVAYSFAIVTCYSHWIEALVNKIPSTNLGNCHLVFCDVILCIIIACVFNQHCHELTLGFAIKAKAREGNDLRNVSRFKHTFTSVRK